MVAAECECDSEMLCGATLSGAVFVLKVALPDTDSSAPFSAARLFLSVMGKKVGVPSQVVDTIGRKKPPPLASNSWAEILRTGVLAPEFSLLVNVWLVFRVAVGKKRMW